MYSTWDSVLNFYLFGDMKRTKRMAQNGKKRTKGTVNFFGKRSGKNDKETAQLLHRGNQATVFHFRLENMGQLEHDEWKIVIKHGIQGTSDCLNQENLLKHSSGERSRLYSVQRQRGGSYNLPPNPFQGWKSICFCWKGFLLSTPASLSYLLIT